MSERVEIDYSLALDHSLGARRGLDLASLRQMAPRMATVHDQVVGAAERGLLPHVVGVLQDDPLGNVLERVRRWRRDCRRVVVLGEPGAVAASTVWTSLAEAPAVVGLTGPDPRPVERAFAGEAEALLLVLDGPGWVRQVAVALAGHARKVVVVAGDGTRGDGWTIGRAARIDAPGAADARFGAFGWAALALTAWAGLDPAHVLEGARSMARRCARRGLFENQALLLASLAWLVRGDRPVVMVPSAWLEPWAAHLVRAWAAVTVRAQDGGAVRVAEGGPGAVVVAGDESLASAVVEGNPDTWVLLLRPRPTGALPLADLGALLVEAHLQQFVRRGRAVVQLRTAGLALADLAATSWLVVHGAVVSSALLDQDPTALPAADALRDLQHSLLADRRSN